MLLHHGYCHFLAVVKGHFYFLCTETTMLHVILCHFDSGHNTQLAHELDRIVIVFRFAGFCHQGVFRHIGELGVGGIDSGEVLLEDWFIVVILAADELDTLHFVFERGKHCRELTRE